MTEADLIPRHFRVRARHEDAHSGRLVSEASFEAAAIAYVEHLAVLADQKSDISVVVHDVHTGHEHSFSVHVEGGDVTLSE